jgi:hypothetical protein
MNTLPKKLVWLSQFILKAALNDTHRSAWGIEKKLDSFATFFNNTIKKTFVKKKNLI